jgi:SAM-dependent methyltransferase
MPDPAPAGAMAQLAAHPWVARLDLTQTGELVAVADAAALITVAGTPGGLVAEHLEHWGEVYDWTYTGGSGYEPTLDLSGWRASDTGEPLPVAVMVEWLDRTVELVLRARPRRLLELGCGTGMLLHRLHPHLRSYVGADIAAEVVDRLTGWALPGVTVVRAAAHEIDGVAVREALAGERPDCVLLNSVTQCFPDTGYLATVLRAAVDLVEPGGTVVIGDVRHAGLHHAFARWVEQALDPAVAGTELNRRTHRRAAADRELLLDPAALACAALGTARDVRIAVHAKPLAADTELGRFRFDAVLHVDAPASPRPAPLVWTNLDALVAVVRTGGSAHVVGIPNALLRPGPGATTAHLLHTALVGLDAAVLTDPADPNRLAVVAPARAAAVPAADLAGPGRPHEPLAAFARDRLGEIVRSTTRRGELPSTPVTAAVPAGRDGTAAGELHRAGLAALSPQARRLATGETADPDGLAAAMSILDAAALATMRDTLLGSRALPADGTPRPIADVVAATGAAPRHHWIVRRWCDALIKSGSCAADGGSAVRLVLTAPPAGVPDDLDRACATLGYPPAMAVLFRAAAAHLPDLLADRVAMQALMFPDGEVLTALGSYQQNVINTYLNGALGSLAYRIARTRPVPLRVLELGAGVGGSTTAVLDAIAGEPVDYLFTDVSRFFLDTARARFGDHPGLRRGLLDINTDLVAQGAAASGYDLVLAANVLHNAHHVDVALRRAADVLAPGGVLAVVESTREHRQAMTSMHFLMSARQGNDHPGAEDVRSGTDRVFLNAREWHVACARTGLRPVLDLPEGAPALDALGQRLLVACR